MHPCRSSPGSAIAILAIAASMAASLFAAGANAQDAPLIDAVGAYNHANVMTRPQQGDDKRDASIEHTGKLPADTTTISRPRFEQLVSDLRAEYRERAGRDGKAHADRWLKQEVDTLRQRYTTVED